MPGKAESRNQCLHGQRSQRNVPLWQPLLTKRWSRLMVCYFMNCLCENCTFFFQGKAYGTQYLEHASFCLSFSHLYYEFALHYSNLAWWHAALLCLCRTNGDVACKAPPNPAFLFLSLRAAALGVSGIKGQAFSSYGKVAELFFLVSPRASRVLLVGSRPGREMWHEVPATEGEHRRSYNPKRRVSEIPNNSHPIITYLFKVHESPKQIQCCRAWLSAAWYVEYTEE